MRSDLRTTKYHWQRTEEKEVAEWPLHLLTLTMGLIWEVAAERKSSFLEKAEKKKKPEHWCWKSPSVRKMLSGRKSVKQLGLGRD